MKSSNIAWLVAYVAMLALVFGGLWYGRSQALAVYGSNDAQTDWDAWRSDATQMAEQPGPVKRRVPKSAQPPALVLMRDHMVACTALSLMLSSVLFATFMFFVRGALYSPGPRH